MSVKKKHLDILTFVLYNIYVKNYKEARPMIVYHGSDTIVETPKILEANRPLDFGGGFYVTTSEEQAKSWAIRVSFRNATKTDVLTNMTSMKFLQCRKQPS